MLSCGSCNATTSGSGDGAALMLCGRCKNIRYCSRDCQSSHWKVHKPKCLTPEERKRVRAMNRETTVKDCNFCKRTKKAGEKAFSSCARCRSARYCSPECQQKDWANHKDTCTPAAHKSKVALNPDQELCQAGVIELSRCKYSGDRDGECRAYCKLGTAHHHLGQDIKAIEYFRQALDISIELSDRAGQCIAYGNLGSAHRAIDQHQEAMNFHTKALNISRELGDVAGVAMASSNLGRVHGNLGHYDKAIALHSKSLDMYRESGDRGGESNEYCSLGMAVSCLDQHDQAIRYFNKHLLISRELGNRGGESNALSNLGQSFFKLRRYTEAIECYNKSLKIDIELGSRNGEGWAYYMLGIALHRLGDYEKAIEYFKKCSNVAQGNMEMEDTAKKGKTLCEFSLRMRNEGH